MPGLTSENKIIQLLLDRYAVKNPLVKKGIGDDAAVIRPVHSKEYFLITTDMLLEGIDFRREWTTPHRLGCKSIAVNLSDLAAMGARPQFFTVSLAVPREISERWILDFYDGMTKTGDFYGAQLIGRRSIALEKWNNDFHYSGGRIFKQDGFIPLGGTSG
jgi:thiamine-monophosphate kinase